MHAELPALTTDPISQGIVATALLALFVLLTMEKSHRVLVALGMVSAIWAISYLTPWKVLTLEAAQAAIDLNVLLLLAGMMAVVGVLKQTGAFEWGVARLLAGRVDQPVVMLSLLIWVTAIASAFLDNVTTVIFVVPITLGVARQLGVDPRGILLPVVMAANVGGTATLIGDPPNIMIGSAAPLAFTDFLINVAAPVLVMMVGLDLASRRRFQAHLRVHPPAPSALDVTIPAIRDRTLLVGMSIVSVAVLIGFLAHGFTGMPAAVPAIIGAAVGLAFQDWLYLRHHKPSAEERRHGILAVIEHEIEWPTLVFFALLFMLVGAAVGTGLIGTLAHGLESAILAGRDAFGLSPRATVIFAALLVMWVAGVMSGIIDNIPFVAVSIPIVATLTGALAEGSNVLWWALALGACLGGNLTPIGASANITTLDLAARQGTRITFREFVRVGIPTVALSLLTASIWVVLYVVLGNRLAAPLSLAAAALLWLGGRAAERITARPSR
jgi:Na+/H+ antiporter NhaD/arsenite permease-like protein